MLKLQLNKAYLYTPSPAGSKSYLIIVKKLFKENIVDCSILQLSSGAKEYIQLVDFNPVIESIQELPESELFTLLYL